MTEKLTTEEKEYRAEHYWTNDAGDIETESKDEPKGLPVFISRVEGSNALLIKIRATGNEGMIGDYEEKIYPGDEAFGYTYDELSKNLGKLIVK